MGLYQSKLSRQLHLRNKQKQEWDMMKKNIEIEKKQIALQLFRQKEMIDQEERDEEDTEIKETELSKKLCSSMVKSSRNNDLDTLQKTVDLLQNMNGNLLLSACLPA